MFGLTTQRLPALTLAAALLAAAPPASGETLFGHHAERIDGAGPTLSTLDCQPGRLPHPPRVAGRDGYGEPACDRHAELAENPDAPLASTGTPTGPQVAASARLGLYAPGDCVVDGDDRGDAAGCDAGGLTPLFAPHSAQFLPLPLFFNPIVLAFPRVHIFVPAVTPPRFVISQPHWLVFVPGAYVPGVTAPRAVAPDVTTPRPVVPPSPAVRAAAVVAAPQASAPQIARLRFASVPVAGALSAPVIVAPPHPIVPMASPTPMPRTPVGLPARLAGGLLIIDGVAYVVQRQPQRPGPGQPAAILAPAPIVPGSSGARLPVLAAPLPAAPAAILPSLSAITLPGPTGSVPPATQTRVPGALVPVTSAPPPPPPLLVAAFPNSQPAAVAGVSVAQPPLVQAAPAARIASVPPVATLGAGGTTEPPTPSLKATGAPPLPPFASATAPAARVANPAAPNRQITGQLPPAIQIPAVNPAAVPEAGPAGAPGLAPPSAAPIPGIVAPSVLAPSAPAPASPIAEPPVLAALPHVTATAATLPSLPETAVPGAHGPAAIAPVAIAPAALEPGAVSAPPANFVTAASRAPVITPGPVPGTSAQAAASAPIAGPGPRLQGLLIVPATYESAVLVVDGASYVIAWLAQPSSPAAAAPGAALALIPVSLPAGAAPTPAAPSVPAIARATAGAPAITAPALAPATIAGTMFAGPGIAPASPRLAGNIAGTALPVPAPPVAPVVWAPGAASPGAGPLSIPVPGVLVATAQVNGVPASISFAVTIRTAR